MTATLGMITVDAKDPRTLGRWWADNLDGVVVEDYDGFFVAIEAPGLPLRLAFQHVEEPTPGKNKIHLDLGAADRMAEVQRWVAAGAVQVDEHRLPGGPDGGEFVWTVLEDPEKNQFCLAETEG